MLLWLKEPEKGGKGERKREGVFCKATVIDWVIKHDDIIMIRKEHNKIIFKDF